MNLDELEEKINKMFEELDLIEDYLTMEEYDLELEKIFNSCPHPKYSRGRCIICGKKR